MELSAPKLHKILTEHGVKEIYHANSVTTACAFLKTGALLSRGTVERRGYQQTTQPSDKDDHEFSLWFDVFADTRDMHECIKKPNIYGPVLFVLNVDILKSPQLGNVWVTLEDPTNFHGLPENKRWFQSLDDIAGRLTPGAFSQMLVFRHCGGELPYGEHLKRIVLDNPQRKTECDHDYYDVAYGALLLAQSQGPSTEVPIEERLCRSECDCIRTYHQDANHLKKMFWPTL